MRFGGALTAAGAFELGFDHIALAAGAVFALGLGLRQAQPLFISSLNSLKKLILPI